MSDPIRQAIQNFFSQRTGKALDLNRLKSHGQNDEQMDEMVDSFIGSNSSSLESNNLLKADQITSFLDFVSSYNTPTSTEINSFGQNNVDSNLGFGNGILYKPNQGAYLNSLSKVVRTSNLANRSLAEIQFAELMTNKDGDDFIFAENDLNTVLVDASSSTTQAETPPSTPASNEVSIPSILRPNGVTGENLTRLQEVLNLLLVGENKVFTTTQQLNSKLTEIAGGSDDDKNRMIYALRTLSSLSSNNLINQLKSTRPIPLQTRWLIGDLLKHSLLMSLAAEGKYDELKSNNFYRKFFEGVGDLPTVAGLGDKFTTHFIPYLSPQTEENFNGGIIGLDRENQFSQGKNFGHLTTATKTLMGANSANNEAKANAWINIYRDLIPRIPSNQYTKQAPNTSSGLTAPKQAFYAFALKMLTDIQLPTKALISRIEMNGEKYKLTHKENGVGNDKTVEVNLKTSITSWDDVQRNVTKEIMNKIIAETRGKTFLVDKSPTGYSDGEASRRTNQTNPRTPSTGTTATPTIILVNTNAISNANPTTYTLPNQSELTRDDIQALMTNWLKAKETVYDITKQENERNSLLTKFTTGKYLQARQAIDKTTTFANQQIISIEDVTKVDNSTYTAVITTKEDQDSKPRTALEGNFTFSKTVDGWKISNREGA